MGARREGGEKAVHEYRTRFAWRRGSGGVPFGVSPAAVVVPEHPGVGQPAAATAAVRAPEVLRKQRIHG